MNRHADTELPNMERLRSLRTDRAPVLAPFDGAERRLGYAPGAAVA